jgi:hypothetical protein
MVKTNDTQPRVGRPATGQNGKQVKLYLNAELRKSADKYAFKKGQSLSALVTELLIKRVGKAK